MALSGGGVVYLDGGWQTLVDGLLAEAQKAKAQVITAKKVVEVRQTLDISTLTSSSWRLHFSDGSGISASTLIITGKPRDVYELFRNDKPGFLSAIADRVAMPVRAACFDIALSSLPNPDIPVAIGVDSPLYLSIHSAAANLAPKGGALIHVMKYLSSFYEPNPKRDRLEMEALLDMIQPGWRGVVVKQRFLPNMIVCNSLVTAAQGGTLGRPDTKVSAAENLYIAGDWVGPQGLLADASFASAKRVAEQILKIHPRLVSYIA